MRLLWEERAWEEYTDWQTHDKKMLKRINALIKDIQRNTILSRALLWLKSIFVLVLSAQCALTKKVLPNNEQCVILSDIRVFYIAKKLPQHIGCSKQPICIRLRR